VDAGSDDLARGMRKFREHERHEHIRFYKNFPVETFIRLMMRCAVMIGNSSAAIREGAFLGTPAVNLGTRQGGRERARNVLDVGHDRNEIVAAVRQQLARGRFETDPMYGDGRAGERIAEVLSKVPLRIQKRVTY
jgi:UDP-N-acetylglucosamine 2-epimerase